MFRTVSRVSILIWAVIWADVSALGLGGLRTESALNQPYVGEIDLFDAKPDELDTVKATLASADDFAKSGLERYHFLTKLAFEPMLSPRGATVIRVTSEEPIREPFVDFLVEVQWPAGRLVKGYTVLLDPPEMRDRRAARTGSPTTAAPRPVDQPASRPRPPQAAQQVPQQSRQAPVQSAPPSAAPEPSSPLTSTVPTVPVGSDGFPIAFGPVRAGQGLLTLVTGSLPQDATTEQTAMALYRNNPDAFIDGNINRLIAGERLFIPTQAELFALDAAAAQRELRDALQGVPVRRAPITDVTQRDATEPAQGGPPRIAGTAESAVPELPAADPVPGAPEQPGEVADAFQPEPPAGPDRIAEKDQQIGELQERILQLETEIEDIQVILEQRDAELVLLRQTTLPASVAPDALGDASTSPADTAPDPSDVTPLVVPVDGPEEPRAPAVSADLASTDMIEPVPVPGDPVDAEAEVPISVPGQPVKSTWHAYLLPLAGFAGVVALGVVGFSLVSARRRRQEQELEEEFEAYDSVKLDESELGPEPRSDSASALPATGAPPVAAVDAFGDDDFTLASTAGPATDSDLLAPSSMMDSLGHFDTETDEADALSEADIYIAYGRYSEAEELLKREVKRAPERLDIRFKLAEVYAGAENIRAMQKLMQQLKASGADVAEPALWQRLVEVAQAFEQRGAREPKARVPKTLSAAVPAGVTGLDRDGVGSGFSLPAGDGDVGEDDSFSLDIGEDLEIAPLLRMDAQPAGPASNVAFKPASNPARGVALDSAGSDSDAPAATQDVDDALPLLFDESALDEPFVLNQFREPGDGALNGELGADSSSGSDLVLTLDDLRESTETDLDAFLKAPSPFGLSSDSEDGGALPDLELPSEFDFAAALDVPKEERVAPTPEFDDFEIPDHLVELADDSPASHWPMDADIWDDNATKLDLARAYIDMDDATAAREVLEEVISAGREEQRSEAEKLLRTLT